MLENWLEIIGHYSLCSILCNQFKETAWRSLTVVVSSLPKAYQLLLVYFRFSAQFRQWAHLLLETHKEHVRKDFRYFKDICAHRCKLVDSKTLAGCLAEDFVNTFVELGDIRLFHGLTLREIELRH